MINFFFVEVGYEIIKFGVNRYTKFNNWVFNIYKEFYPNKKLITLEAITENAD